MMGVVDLVVMFTLSCGRIRQGRETAVFGYCVKKVALKFCGGCDPAYDRVEYWEEIRDAAGDRIVWVSMDDEGYEAVLGINGCKRACLEEELGPLPRFISLVEDDRDIQQVVNKILEG